MEKGMAGGMARGGARKRYVSPTDLAGMAKCEMQVYLKARGGESMTDEGKAAADRGTAAHSEWERAGGGVKADSRCFVASWALGPDDPDTARLRAWRDGVLVGLPGGRFARDAYYAASPVLIRLLSQVPGARRAAAWAVRLAARALAGRKP